jgi:hypothetical protein
MGPYCILGTNNYDKTIPESILINSTISIGIAQPWAILKCIAI